MVKVNAQAFTYGIAFAACGVLALVGIKFTKSDEEKIKMLVSLYTFVPPRYYIIFSPCVEFNCSLLFVYPTQCRSKSMENLHHLVQRVMKKCNLCSIM